MAAVWGMGDGERLATLLGVTGGGGGGGWALTAHTTGNNVATGGNGATPYTTAAVDTTGSTLLVVAVAWYNGGRTPAVSDSKGNTWTALTAAAGGTGSVTLFYCLAPTVGSGHTFSVTADFSSCAVAAFSGGGSAKDQSAGAGSASATTQQPGSVTPGSSGELLVSGACLGGVGFTVSVDSGYTQSDFYLDSTATVFNVALAYLSQGAAAASNPTWTRSTSERIAASIVTFAA